MNKKITRTVLITLMSLTLSGCSLFTHPVEVTGISIDVSELSLKKGSNYKLEATIEPVDATNKTITWTSSDENIVTVDDGEITAVSIGSATITVTTKDGNKTCECKVTVTPNYILEIDKLQDVVRFTSQDIANLDVSTVLKGLKNGDSVEIKWNGKPSADIDDIVFQLYDCSTSELGYQKFYETQNNFKQSENMNIDFITDVNYITSDSKELYCLFIYSNNTKDACIISDSCNIQSTLTLNGKNYCLVYNEEFNKDLIFDRPGAIGMSLNGEWSVFSAADADPTGDWADRKTQRTEDSVFSKAVLEKDIISKGCFSIKDGILHIVQKRELDDNTMRVWEPTISSHKSFKRGYFEYKWKYPKRVGGVNLQATMNLDEEDGVDYWVGDWKLKWLQMHELFSGSKDQVMYSPSICSQQRGNAEYYGINQYDEGQPTFNETVVYDIKDEDFFDVWHITKLLWDAEGLTIWEDDKITLTRKWSQMYTGEPKGKMYWSTGCGNGGEWIYDWFDKDELQQPWNQKTIKMLGAFDPYATEIDYQVDYFRVYQLPEDM